MKKSAATKGESPSRLIDARIKELDDWRGKTLARVRALIKQADPEVVEEWKWRGVPVWSHDGLICTGETYKSVVKLTFAKGASLKDPSEPIQKVVESNESLVIPCVAPESQTWGAACGSLNTVVLPITVAFAIRAI